MESQKNIRISKQLINQIKHSEDRIIVINETGEPQTVLMSWQAYTKLTQQPPATQPRCKSINSQEELTNNKILDKINQEIAQLQNREKQNPISLEDSLLAQKKKITDNSSTTNNADEEDSVYLEIINE